MSGERVSDPGPDPDPTADSDAVDGAAATDGEPHVVVLEDDDSLRRLLGYKLEANGFETTTLSDGRECWARLTAEPPPELVLADVMVPGLNGFRLLERIRADERLADVPVVLLTARGREEDVLRGFELGADDYVTKPFSPSVLVARLRRLVA